MRVASGNVGTAEEAPSSENKKAGTPLTGDPASCGLDRPYRWWRWAERSQKTSNSLIPLVISGWRALARRYLKRYMILILSGGAAQALASAILRATPIHLQGRHASTEIPPRVREGGNNILAVPPSSGGIHSPDLCPVAYLRSIQDVSRGNAVVARIG